MFKEHRSQYVLSAVLAALMLAQALLGLIFQELYRDAAWIKAAWLGNDWVTLVVAVPTLIAGLALARRGSTLGVLLWLGVLGYAAYNYAYYLFGVALNVFLPLYVVILVLSAITLIATMSHLDAAAVAARFRPKTPVRIVRRGLSCFCRRRPVHSLDRHVGGVHLCRAAHTRRAGCVQGRRSH